MTGFPLRRGMLLPLLCLLVLSTGCNDDDVPTSPVIVLDETATWAATPQELMTDFRAAYDAMDVEPYLDCLIPQFKHIGVPGSRICPTSWSLASERTNTERLFGGEPGYDRRPEETLPGVVAVDFRYLEQTTEWEPYPDDDWYCTDCLIARFSLELVFSLEDGRSLTVAGDEDFFLRNDAVTVSGEERDHWRIAYVQDIPGKSSAVDGLQPWKEIKIMYWAGPPTAEPLTE